MTQNIDQLKEQEKTASEVYDKRQWDMQYSGLFTGAAFILAGTLLLLNQYTDFSINNWWALFIFIPAFSTLGHAWHVYQRRGDLGHDGRGALVTGLVMAAVAVFFLFDLPWDSIWPLILVAIGVAMIFKKSSARK